MFGQFSRHYGPPWAQRGEYEHRGHHHGPYGHRHGWHHASPEQQALFSTAAEVARLFAIAGRSSVDNPEKRAQLRAFLERSRTELADLIYGTGQKSDTPSDVNQA